MSKRRKPPKGVKPQRERWQDKTRGGQIEALRKALVQTETRAAVAEARAVTAQNMALACGEVLAVVVAAAAANPDWGETTRYVEELLRAADTAGAAARDFELAIQPGEPVPDMDAPTTPILLRLLESSAERAARRLAAATQDPQPETPEPAPGAEETPR